MAQNNNLGEPEQVPPSQVREASEEARVRKTTESRETAEQREARLRRCHESDRAIEHEGCSVSHLAGLICSHKLSISCVSINTNRTDQQCTRASEAPEVRQGRLDQDRAIISAATARVVLKGGRDCVVTMFTAAIDELIKGVDGDMVAIIMKLLSSPPHSFSIDRKDLEP